MPAQGVRRSEDKSHVNPLPKEVQEGSDVGLKRGGFLHPKGIQSELEGDSKSDLELTIDIVAATLQLKLLNAVCARVIAFFVGELTTAVGGGITRQYRIVFCGSVVVIQRSE